MEGEMKRILATLFIAVLVSGMSCGAAWAQATAQISGAVQDQSGAVLPGAEISATQTETGVSRMTITNETGYYVLPNLPLGPYRLEASLPGFRTYVQTGIVLQVNSNPSINVVLQVGQVSEQVEVQANASLVETRTLSVGQVMETARIMELPLNGRNAQELVLLQGGAAQVNPAGGYTFGANRITISTAGSLGLSMEYTLDGIRHIDAYDGVPLPLPFPDALAEFKTEIGGMSAQQARGSQVSAVTKSGTNQFHGDLFEFVRNDLFNARNFYAAKGSTLKRNQFGGTVGGPVIKNKLFFFAAYQGTTLRQDPNDVRSFVPTAAMLAGDFTSFSSAACNAKGALTLKTPFAGNRIDPSLFSPVAKNLAARLPKTDNPCGEVTYGRRSVNDQAQLVGKVDYQWTAQHSLFGRLIRSTNDTTTPLIDGNVLTAGDNTIERSYAFTAGSTYLLSSTTVNALRVSFSRNTQRTLPKELFSASELGAKVYDYIPKVMSLNVTSSFSLGGNFRRIGTNLYQLSDDVSMTRGTHQFGFGGRIAQSRTTAETGATIFPTFSFNGLQTGAGLGDFLLGKASDYNQGLTGLLYNGMNFVSLYGQDTWQVTPRVSMSYGLRWAPVLPLMDYRRPVPIVSNFDLARYRQGLRSTMFVNAPPGFLYPGDPGFAQDNNGADAAKPRANVWDAYWKQFAPRIGLAWDIQGNGRTSIRASYGMSYEDYPAISRIGTQQQQPPWGSTTRVLQPAGGLDNPWLGITGGNPHPLQLTRDMPFVPQGDYMPNLPNLTPTYTQSWNMSLQREVVPGTLLSMSYLGTQVTHLEAANPLNLSIYIPGVGDAAGNCFLNGKVTPYKVNPASACSTIANTQDRRVLSLENPAFGQEIGRLAIVTNGGTQNYHGLLASVQHRTANSFTVNGNYTWAHCVGDYSSRSNGGYGASVNHTYQDPANRRRDRANCEVDQRHVFNLTAVAETPKFANRTVSLLATGWRLSGIYRASTGGTVAAANRSTGNRTITLGAPSAGNRGAVSGDDRCLCNIDNQRPDLLLPDAVYLDTSGRPDTQYLNPKAFGLPALGTLGNMGAVNLKLPRAWQFDVALGRVFRFREMQSLEFRAEAYNVLNSFRPGDIDTNLSSAQFGKIRTALDPRILQFALKYLF
jgi:hypothetical protein